MKTLLTFVFTSLLLVPSAAWAADVEGTVTSADGKGLSRALVVFSQGGEEKARVATRSDGTFTVRDLPAGRYEVKVAYRSRTKTFSDVAISAAGGRLDFKL